MPNPAADALRECLDRIRMRMHATVELAASGEYDSLAIGIEMRLDAYSICISILESAVSRAEECND